MAPYEQSQILDRIKTCPTLPTPQQYNNKIKGCKYKDQTKDSMKIPRITERRWWPTLDVSAIKHQKYKRKI